jgi:hypothetical protein
MNKIKFLDRIKRSKTKRVEVLMKAKMSSKKTSKEMIWKKSIKLNKRKDRKKTLKEANKMI